MKKVFKRALAVLLVIAMITSTLTPFIQEAQAASFSYTGSSSYRSGKYYTRLKNLTKTGNQRVDIVNVAESQIGYQEGASSSKLSGEVRGSGNCTEYGRWYGMQDMWCAMFVSWCAHVAGVPTSVVPSHAYTPSGLSWFKSRGLAYSRKQVANGEYTPQPGDIIYFKSSRNQNTTNHIGIVTGYSNGTVYTVEGNTSSATISTNGGAVAAKSYSISNTYIVYICKPNYSVPSVQEETVEQPLKGVVFNSDYYAWKCANEYGVNPGSTEAERYKHYINTGIKNGYQASPNFDVKYYLQNNPHVQTAIGSSTDYQKAYQYFIDQGYLEVVLTAKPEDIGHDFYAEIVMASSGMLLSANSDDRNVILSDTSVSRSKKWRFFRQENGSYKIVNAKSSLSLAVTDKARTSGSNVEVNVGYGGTSQSWFFYKDHEGKYIIRPYCSAYSMLDVYGGTTEAGTNIEIYEGNGSIAQYFYVRNIAYDGTEYAEDLGEDILVTIYNKSTGKYLANSTTNVQGKSDSNKVSRVWRMVHQSDGSYTITGQFVLKSMTVEGDGSAGSGVELTPYAGNANQKWMIYRTTEGYTIKPMSDTTGCRLVGGTLLESGFTEVEINTPDNAGNSHFFLINEVDYLNHIAYENRGDEFYAKIKNYGSDKNLSLSGTNVIQYSESTSPAQVWRFVRQDDGSYKIINQKNGMILDTETTEGTDDLNVKLSLPGKEVNSGWYLYYNGGVFTLKPTSSSNCVLTIDGGSSEDAANVQINNFAGVQDSQRFWIDPINYLDVVGISDVGEELYTKITHTASGKRVCLERGTSYDVTIESDNNDAGQTWYFEKQSDGSYTVRNQGNGHYLNVKSDYIVNTHGKEASGFMDSQRWFVYLQEGSYVLRSVAYPDFTLSLENGSTTDGTNIRVDQHSSSTAQLFSITDDSCGNVQSNSLGITAEQMEVFRNIMYAVETGGQEYGGRDYADFTEAYTNTSEEHAITIGAGQWYGPEAKTLLKNIRSADPTLFASLDTAGISSDLDSANWSTYKLSKDSAKAECIVKLITTDVGIRCQDQLMDEQLEKYLLEAQGCGVENIDAQMMVANIRHLGGLSAVKRILNKTATPYTLDNIYEAMQTDTGNQAGAPIFASRHKFVVKYLKMYIPSEPISTGTHSYDSGTVTKEATCSEYGIRTYTCENCNCVKNEAIPMTNNHTWKAATCEEPKTCQACNTTSGEALGHNWSEATCTTPKTCSVCKTTSGEVSGHSWNAATCTEPKTCTTCHVTVDAANGHDWKAATCTTPKTCTICKETEGSALDHSWSAATCEEPKTCTVCKVTSGSALGHSWKAATCTAPKTCTTCKVKSGDALGHNWTEATCTTAKTCATCKATTGQALGHSWSEATCTTPKTCQACKATTGNVISHSWTEATCTAPKTCKTCKEASGSALGHSWKAATCTEPKTCATCKATTGQALGHSWSEATCTEPKTCKTCKTTSGEALGHSWNEATCTAPKTCTECNLTVDAANGHDWKAATCTEPKTCRICKTTSGSALNHSWKEATCTEPKTCQTCKTTSGNKLGHSWKEATCTEPKTCQTCKTTSGSKLGHSWEAATCEEPKTCKTCKTTSGEALGHSWNEATCTAPKTCTECHKTVDAANGHDWKAATCTEPKTCKICKTTSGEILGHNWKAATCTAAKTCTTCKATSGSALGHSWKDATCEEPKTCTTCKTTSGEALGHSWNVATCTEPKICTVCHKTVDAANGHDWKAATCTEPKTCTVCKTTSGSALGHSWKAATCTEPKTCTVCKTTSGSALGHSWKAATCTAAKTCTVCKTTSGSALGHSWKAATCTTAKTCKTCKTTSGSALGHTDVNEKDGSCDRCSTKLSAQKPEIVKNPVNKTYKFKATATALKVDAKSTDGGTLSYQWYTNSKKSTTGSKLIKGATNKTYVPDTTKAGTYYYYCVVTNTTKNAINTKTAKVTTAIAKITVNKGGNSIKGVDSTYNKTLDTKKFKLSVKANGDIKFSSSNKKVVTVDAKGNVTLKGAGTANITITAGNSNYKTVTKVVKVNVAPKKAKLTTVTSSKKKSITIKWNKVSDITGYKIQYSTNKNFKNAKTYTVGKGSVSKTYSNLKSGKRVYVRICAYKKTSQGTYQGNWSSVKSCVIK